MRLTGLAVVSFALFALIVSGCGGGGSSPTEPAEPVPLEGTWSGSVTVTSPNRTTCTMSFTLVRDAPAYLGNWSAQCADGTQGNGIVAVTPTFSTQAIVSALRPLNATTVFGGCGWGSTVTRDGSRLRGDWSTTQNCATGPVLSGRMEMSKQ